MPARNTLVHVDICREGPRVTLAARDADGKSRVTLTMHARGAAGIASLVASAAGAEDDWEGEVAIRAELEVRHDE